MPSDPFTTETSPLLGSSGTGSLEPQIEALSAGAHETVDRVAGSVTGAARRLSAKRARFTAASRDTVSRHPMATVAIAVAAGMLLSRLTGGRHPRDVA